MDKRREFCQSGSRKLHGKRNKSWLRRAGSTLETAKNPSVSDEHGKKSSYKLSVMEVRGGLCYVTTADIKEMELEGRLLLFTISDKTRSEEDEESKTEGVGVLKDRTKS